MLSRIFKISQARFCSQKLLQFTDFYAKKLAEESNQQVSTGRSWKSDELRLKSEQDLKQLWYVLLIEKNLLESDNKLKRKIQGGVGSQGRLSKVRVSMARLLTVVNERKKIQNNYREYLENEYIAQQRIEYMNQVEEKKKDIQVPEITQELLRDKFKDLKKGIDNTDYIQKTVDIAQRKKELREQLDIKYGQVKQSKFDNSFEKQLDEGLQKISQEEVLRSHIKNWKNLNLKQRRVVLGFLNAKRAREAKKLFIQELNLLSQKIAFDNLKNKTS